MRWSCGTADVAVVCLAVDVLLLRCAACCFPDIAESRAGTGVIWQLLCPVPENAGTVRAASELLREVQESKDLAKSRRGHAFIGHL